MHTSAVGHVGLLLALSLGLGACGQGGGQAQSQASVPPAVQTLQALAISPGALPGVPAELAVPAGHTLFRRDIGVGLQIYACAQNAQGAYTWTFQAPWAKLFGAAAGPFGPDGVHFAGPTWQDDRDGSSVVGRAIKNAPAPAPAPAIPWLLIEARATTPAQDGQAGAFSATSFVRRLYTQGGTAPTSGCDASTLGQQARVPYAALYEFYRPAR